MSKQISAGHEDIMELLGAYALDAVDAPEAELVARHLEVCPRCRAEVQEHREVAGLLGYAGQEAPAGLWDRISASMQEAPPALRLQRTRLERGAGAPGPWALPGSGAPVGGPAPVGVAATGTAAAGGPFAAGGPRAAGGPGPGDPGVGGPGAPVASLAEGRRRVARRTFGVRSMAALAAAAAVAIAVLGLQVARLDHRTSSISHDMAVGAPSMSAVDRALAVPGARKVVLAADTRSSAVDAVILPGGQGFLYDPKLHALGADQTYQLWGVTDGGTISYGILGSTPAQVVSFQAGDDVKSLAITAEVAGGAARSTHAPVAAGAVPTV